MDFSRDNISDLSIAVVSVALKYFKRLHLRSLLKLSPSNSKRKSFKEDSADQIKCRADLNTLKGLKRYFNLAFVTQNPSQ